MIKIRIISAAVLLVALIIILEFVRRKKMRLKYALPWIVAVIIAMFVDMFPSLLFTISELIGIETPSNALFLIALCLMLCLLFVMTLIVSRQSERIKKMAQTVALNEERIRVLENKK